MPGDSSRTRHSGSHDGTFTLFYRDGQAHLTVYPPEGSGRPVYAEDVENRMRLLGVPRVSRSRIREIIETASGTPEPLVAWPAGKDLAARIQVDVSSDGLEARVTVEPPRKGGAPPIAEDIERELASAGVRFGIDYGEIRHIVTREVRNESRVVARGTPPVHGKASSIRYHFNTDRLRPYLVMPFDRINLKELNFIEHCESGRLLADLAPPVEPVGGRSVTGEHLPADPAGAHATLVAGENTTLSDDGTRLYAACDGNVRLDDRGRVTVEPVVRVEHVNYATGNIHFDGSVIVEGSIADGFVVEAGGDLQVGKGVGKSTLRVGRNLVLKTGINGGREAVLECGGDLYARFLESCEASAKGHAFVEEAVMHTDLSAGGHCILGGRRAEIIAGRLIAGGSVWCKKIGNVNEARTHVAVGVAPPLLLAYYHSAGELDAKEEELGKVEESLAKLEKAIEEGRSNERVTQAKQRLAAVVPGLRAERSRLRREVPERRDELAPDRSALVVAQDTIFPGVKVTFGTHEYRPSDAGSHKTILHLTPTGIQEAGFDLRNPPALDFSR